MRRLHELIGVEGDLGRTSAALRQFAQELDAPVVGGYQVTCSDEAEWECAAAFQYWFAREMLPPLKADTRAPMRSINLGGRYEWGAVRVAEEHYAVASPEELKLVVVKINAHTGVHHGTGGPHAVAGLQAAPHEVRGQEARAHTEGPPSGDDGPEYGILQRYGHKSACCGALAGLFEGSLLPAIQELRKTFNADGKDRMAILGDRKIVPGQQRALLVAVTSARLQARRAVLDIQEYRPSGPTVFLVLPCVTINRPGPDTEVVVGQYGVDRTGRGASVKYSGLGDDPAEYRVRHEQGRVIIEDDQWPGEAPGEVEPAG